MGKMMQKAGGMFGHKGMKEKGTAKREAAGYGEYLKDENANGGEQAEEMRERDMERIDSARV